MARRLDARDPGFRVRLRGASRRQARGLRGRRRRGPGHHRRCPCPRRRGASSTTPARFDALELTPQRLRVAAAEIDAAADACPPAALAALGLARERIEAYHRAQRPQDHATTDALGVSARLALDGDRIGRALRAGRHRELSVLRPDERRAGEGRGRAAGRHGGADAARRREPAGARGGAARRRRRDLPDRRRAGGRGARLRDGDDRAASPRSSGPATPMWRRPSAGCSARSAST